MKYSSREDKREEAHNPKGISVVWKNLSVIVEQRKHSIFRKTEKSEKCIIHNVTGAIFPSNLVAVMGASGSGKTTLLTTLAHRTTDELKIQGDIRVDGKSSKEFLRKVSGFVYQDDLFIPELTVMEHLNFAAKLRLNRNIGASDRKKMILKVLREVGLLKLENVLIGGSNPGEGVYLSGGERKRLSVATELLTGSQLLFCDEPTTGLDSYSSKTLMSIMHNLVIESDKTIVCTIHQPNKQTFEVFQQIILLSDGHIVFNGSTSDAIKFFEGMGYQYDDDKNPAEYFIASVADKRKKEIEENSETTLHSDFLKSVYFQYVQNYIYNVMTKQPDTKKFTSNITISRTWFSKLITVTHRNFIPVMKTSSPHNIRLFNQIILSIFAAICLHGAVKNTQSGIKAIEGALYIIITGNLFTPLSAVLTHIPNQIPLFYREYSNNSTSPSVFYLSNILSLLPNFLLEPLCTYLIIGILAGLRNTYYALIISAAVSILLFNGCAAIGIILSLFFPDPSIAVAYGDEILYIFYTCSGLFLRLSSIPYYLSWIQYISVVTYASSALYVAQFEDLHYIKCETNPNVPCYRNGLEVLRNFDYDKNSLYHDIIMMLLLYFVFHVIAYLCFLYRVKNRTR